MKRVLVTFVLALTAGAMTFAQQPTAPASPQGEPPAAQQNTPTSQKVIKDPAEYNAYITALNTTDPAAKAAAMEAFVTQYPNSIVKVDALEQAMAAYQQSQNQAKVEDTAKRILQINPNNVRALAIVTFIDRAKASAGNNPQALQSTCSESDAGIKALPTWQKPEGTTDADFEKLKTQMSNIFEGAAGFCALQAKNYAVAQEHYAKSLQTDGNNFGDTFQLAVAELESNPPVMNGYWHCARAINLAQSQNNAPGAQSINSYCKAKYHNYHGNDQGWDEFAKQYGAATAPPANIAQLITPKPTACDLAVQAVKENDITQLSFGDKEFILQQKGCSPAGTDAADKVWQSIQDLQKGGQAKLKIPVKVIAATTDSIDAAITDDNQQANKADIHVVMEKPVTKPPAAGTMTDIIGIITSYTPNPFMFTMEKGELPAAKKAPVHHAPTKKKKKA
jgi:tetratricopeptide (TPR) repeat protein